MYSLFHSSSGVFTSMFVFSEWLICSTSENIICVRAPSGFEHRCMISGRGMCFANFGRV